MVDFNNLRKGMTVISASNVGERKRGDRIVIQSNRGNHHRRKEALVLRTEDRRFSMLGQPKELELLLTAHTQPYTQPSRLVLICKLNISLAHKWPTGPRTTLAYAGGLLSQRANLKNITLART
jgi:hypothetical protein